MEENKHRGLQVIRELRCAGYSGHIVVGGYFPTFSSREILRDFPEIDFVVRGEGEITLGELMEKVLGGQKGSLENIQGLSYRENGTVRENPTRPLIKNLDTLPPVERKYSKEILKSGTALRVFATRGCWGGCSFCDIIAMYGSSAGKSWRSRSIPKLIDEIEDLKNRFHTDYFIFNDDQFLIRGKKADERVDQFASELKRRQLTIRFELMCRADTVTRRNLAALKSVGLKRVFLGLESFDDKQLERFHKSISVRQNLRALIILYQLNIDVVASVILADAYTTFRDIIRQFIFLFQLRRRYFTGPDCQISVNERVEIYRGSATYQEYKRKGLLTNDHYLQAYTYRLKFWTAFRLRMFDIESFIGRVLLHPLDFVFYLFNTFRWSIRQVKYLAGEMPSKTE
jgi:radical SAM superfamily enzyme YgiQ (UPF0313 family)